MGRRIRCVARLLNLGSFRLLFIMFLILYKRFLILKSALLFVNLLCFNVFVTIIVSLSMKCTASLVLFIDSNIYDTL